MTDNADPTPTSSSTLVPLRLRAAPGPNGGHALTGVVVPFDEVFEIGPDVVERFERGAFTKTLAERGDRVALLEGHDRHRWPIGRAVEWEQTDDALIGTFALADTARTAEALALIDAGIVTGLSVGFRRIRSSRGRLPDGRTEIIRREVALDHVGLVAEPAYDSARVLAARDAEIPPRLARWRAIRRTLT